MQIRHRLRRMLVLLGVNSLVFLLMMLLLECVFRFVSPQTLRKDAEGFNEAFGHFYRPKPNMEVQVSGPEGATTWKTNSHGLRDSEISYEKPFGTFRIVGLGDSFTFGYCVEQEESFLHQLEGLLNSSKRLQRGEQSKRFETVNLGVGGYGTVAELNMLRVEGLKYQPDLVLLALFVGNDIQDSIREHAYLRLPHGASPGRHPSTVEVIKKFLGKNLHVYSFASVRFHELLIKLKLRKIDESTIEILKTMPSIKVLQAWKIVEDSILDIQSLSSEAGAEFLVVLIPIRHQVQRSEWDTICKTYNLRQIDYDVDRPQKYLSEFFVKNHITYVDLLTTFRSDNTTEFNMKEDAHFNEYGHSVAAKALLDSIVQLLM